MKVRLTLPVGLLARATYHKKKNAETYAEKKIRRVRKNKQCYRSLTVVDLALVEVGRALAEAGARGGARGARVLRALLSRLDLHDGELALALHAVDVHGTANVLADDMRKEERHGERGYVEGNMWSILVSNRPQTRVSGRRRSSVPCKGKAKKCESGVKERKENEEERAPSRPQERE
jgi:hypothetical protein